MNKESIYGEIKISDIKNVANSRFRDIGDVADLIASIKVNGLLQPILIRKEDNALICGNRRVEAYRKMNLKIIKCVFESDVSDTQLIAKNIDENDKRKQITSVEYGRAIKIMMDNDKNLTMIEVAAMLSKPATKISSYLKIYKAVAGTPYEKYVVQGRKVQGIPEEFIPKCYSILSRVRINRILSKLDWDILLEAAKNRELPLSELSPLKQICIAKPNIRMDLAIERLKDCKVVHTSLPFNFKVLSKEMSNTKCTGEAEFVRFLIRKYNRDLLF